MRRSLLLALLLVTHVAFSQLRFQGGFIAGPTPNSVDIVIRPTVAFTGYLTDVSFVIQIPTTAIPQPTITLTSLATNFPTLNFLQWTDPAVDASTPGYRNYGISCLNASNTTPISISALSAYPVVRVTFSGGPVVATAIRLAHLPSGGNPPTSQFQFYVEANDGVVADDYTDFTHMFFGANIFPLTPLLNATIGWASYQYAQIFATLPIRWLSFNVARQINNGLVLWEVDGDEDNLKYIVERSFDGGNFVPVGEVKKSSGTGVKQYSFIDKNITSLGSKVIYYRVKNVELSSKYTYTEIKSIRLDTRGDILLFPNPAKNGFTLTVPFLNSNQQRVQLHLINALGQVVDRKDISRLAATNYYYNLQSSLIVSGEYLLNIYEDGELTETKRVLIKK